MRRSFALVTLALALAACGDDDGSNECTGRLGPAGTRELTVESAGVQRTFLVTAPESALIGEPVPLVVVYHGVLADAATIQTVTGFPEKAAAEGFITVAGDGIGRSWNAGLCCDPAMSMGVDDVEFARDMVAAVAAEYCIDERRVFATGFSNGSAMVFRLACEASDRFTAFGPVGGSLALLPCTPSQPRPIEIINNVDDPIVPFALGETFSFPAALEWNGCDDNLTTEQPAATATCRAAICAGEHRTAFCGVEGLSHVWPGGATDPDGEFRATDHIWSFFAAAVPD
jgi:polyhydroxybutyrate depolymerase